jgi:hypothetical protein
MESDLNLPPLVAEIANGSVTWHRIEGLDYQAIGYFLSCHLIIEQYLDEYLKLLYAELDWDAARLTFNHKVSLLSRFKVGEKYDCISAIKHLNSLRNKLSHNIEFKIEASDLLPLTQYLTKAYEGNKSRVPKEPKDILSHFTSLACVLFAGLISGYAQVKANPKVLKSSHPEG